MDDVVNFRPDGSISFDVDDEHIVWRPPRVKHVRAARNKQFDITNRVRELNDVSRELGQRAKTVAIAARAADDSDEAARLTDEARGLAHEADQASRAQIDEMTRLYAGWVADVHGMLKLQGELPDHESEGELADEWPSWLPTIQFCSAVLRHWGTHPFGSSNGGSPAPRVTAP